MTDNPPSSDRMAPAVVAATLQDIAPLRAEFRAEAACQIVHDSLYQRRGWCLQYLLKDGDVSTGFAGVAVGGPWKGRRTLFDFYVRRAWRGQWRELWAVLVAATGADSYELQTNLPLMPELTDHLAGEQQTECIVYGEGHATALPSHGTRMRCLTAAQETRQCMQERAGQSRWALELDEAEVGQGALLFHYNEPYADLAMDIHEAFRRRGFGAYLVQELKRCARELGAIPGARSSATNFASHRTLEKAGLTRVGRIVVGRLATA